MALLVWTCLLLIVLVLTTRESNADLKAAIAKQMMEAVEREALAVKDDMVHEVDSETEDGSSFADALLDQSDLSLRFDCGSRNETACEQKYCVFYNGQCMVSPAGIDLSCNLYCGLGCTPSESTDKKRPSCTAKVSSYFGLCPAFQEEDNCNAQTLLCEWKNGACGYVESCCSLALDYCLNKKHKSKAVKGCSGLTNGKSLCQG